MGDLYIEAEAQPSELVKQSRYTEVSRGRSTEEDMETCWREGPNP